jgi:TonB family protein
VDIVSTPSGAAVRIGPKVVGQTPITGLELKAGTHTVTVGKEGYEPFSAKLYVSAGKRARLEAPLRAIVMATAPPTPKPEVSVAGRVWDEDEVDRAPKKSKGDWPKFPDDKLGKLKSGDDFSVTLTWVVTEDGEVTDVKVTEPSGVKVLDETVVEAVRKQRYKPGAKKDTPVKVRMTRVFSFRKG